MKQQRLRAWRLARAARRAERQTAPASPSPDLPAIAAKAGDLEAIKKSVEDAASVSGGLWLSYLFVLSYIAIAAGAVTHEDLLLERPVKLPFLNVELPLLAFFALAPFVVLIIHAYALMHFIMLGKKASRFHDELRRQFPDQETKAVESGASSDSGHKEIRDNKRWLLPSNIFVQILAGPAELRAGFFGLMLKIIALTTLVALPVLVLLLLQIQFLPFHDARITWAQRAALFFDVVLLWPLRPPILANLNVASSQRAQLFSRVLRWFGFVLAGVVSIAVVGFSILIATFPGEWRPVLLTQVAELEWATKTAFGEVDPLTQTITGGWPTNTLRLQGFDIYEALKVDDPKKLDWKDHTFDLHSRRLEGAVFNNAKLGKVNLRGANLKGASLVFAKLQGASLVFVQLQGAALFAAELQGASLDSAKLQGASFNAAKLQGASLDNAKLQGASFGNAELRGASLLGANLQGASLYGANLQGASLYGANLQGALLKEAELQGASLDYAQLQGAALDNAELQGASFVEAKLRAVRLDDATRKSLLRPVDSVDPHLSAKAYAKLRDSMKSIPEGRMREEALRRIEALDCGNPDKTLASCDPAAKPPREVLDWENRVARASVDDAAYAKALATELRSLLCANDENAIYILRAIIVRGDPVGRLAETGREAPRLVDFIMSKNCPVSASLTDDDKTRLLEIKQEAEQKSAPPSVSKKDK